MSQDETTTDDSVTVASENLFQDNTNRTTPLLPKFTSDQPPEPIGQPDPAAQQATFDKTVPLLKKDASTRLGSSQTESESTIDIFKVKDAPEEYLELTQASSGTTKQPKADLPPVTLLKNRFRLIKSLGSGGFGIAYLAEDVELAGQLCVVKHLRGAHQLDPIKQANFRQEAQLLVELNHPGHDNIPAIFDAFVDANGSYLVMKYIQGQNLKDALQARGQSFEWEYLLKYAEELCSALHYMHSRPVPVLHRDIKPANILLGDDERIWLIDFGLAKARLVQEESDDPAVSKAAGSLGYTALEQWYGEAEPASDIYSLGVTLHHLLSGLNPVDKFKDKSESKERLLLKLQKFHGQLPPLNKVDPTLPGALTVIIEQATHYDPEQRPTALQLQKQFQSLRSKGQDLPLYTFRNGESAYTRYQLFELCEENRREAQNYLYRGDLEQWFRLTGRHELADMALKAVRQGKSNQDRLDKFLGWLIPNLRLQRLWRATKKIGAWSLKYMVTSLIVTLLFLLVVFLGVSTFAGQALGRRTASQLWSDSVQNGENQLPEVALDTLGQSAIEWPVNDIHVDIRPDNNVDIWLTILGTFPIYLPVTFYEAVPETSPAQTRPQIELGRINDLPTTSLTRLFINNFNAGIDNYFESDGIGLIITDLTTSDTALSFVAQGATSAVASPNGADAIPAYIVVFNRLPQTIEIDLNGVMYGPIEANEVELIQLPSGDYSYAVRTLDNQLADEGQRTLQGDVTLLYIEGDITTEVE